MANMSYCRFENTLADLRDCADNMYDDDLNDSEKRSRKQMIRLCIEIAEEFSVGLDEE